MTSGGAPAHATPVDLGRTLTVIPSINGAHLLGRMLPSLDVPRNTVVVLDQGSTDATAQVCRDFGVELLQLGAPRTYTESCNMALQLARERHADYVFIANNDIRFVTRVASELLAAMLDDPGLAVAAPSQVIIDEKRDRPVLANRVTWDLANVEFVHDIEPLGGEVERLEADFCELTLAVVRVSAALAVGGFDEDYAFYHEDADLCFRLRVAGYSCAYLPQSQIEHYQCSTFDSTADLSARKLREQTRSRRLFAQKHLGYGVDHADHRTAATDSWSLINRSLHPALERHGLLMPDRPHLIFAHPGTEPLDYLYTVWETDALPEAWKRHAASYRAVMVPSTWGRDVLRDAGFPSVHHVPLGVDTDVFNPWGPRDRLHAGPTILWFARNQHRKGLDVMLRAWGRVRGDHPDARLVVMGHGVSDSPLFDRSRARHRRQFVTVDCPEDGLVLEETVLPLSAADLAILYRSVDVLVCTSRSEGFGFSVAEAMACGTVPVFPDYAASADMAYEGALTFPGTRAKADYSDKGFGDVGCWWEPDEDRLVSCLRRALSMDARERSGHVRRMSTLVRNRFTWRNTCFAIREVLVARQAQADVRIDTVPAGPPVPSPLELAIRIEKDEARRPRPRRLPLPPGRAAIAKELDQAYYVANNPDIAAVGADPLTHYARYGWLEDRHPSATVTTSDLLSANATVRKALIASSAKVHKAEVRKDEGGGPTRPPYNLQDLRPGQRSEVRNGTLFVGYVEAGLGLGESLRGLITAADHAGVDYAVHPFNARVDDRFVGRFRPERYDQANAYRVNVLEMAADQVPDALRELGKRRTKNSYTVLRTYWELPHVPPSWVSHLDGIDELWAPTRFVADAFRPVFRGPITLVPPFVDVRSARPDRQRFGLEDGVFYFLFSFDYFSSAARKNPLGLIEAFEEAFPTRDAGVGLIVKSVGPPDMNGKVRSAIAKAVARDPRIVNVDQSLDRASMLSLLASADSYVSLHRSEGFGLGMAESMALGRIVVGTDFSGSTDFLTPATGYPVAYTERPLREGEYYAYEGQTWAEPDPGAAVACLRAAYTDRERNHSLAAAGQRAIEEIYGEDAVGTVVRTRLEALTGLRGKSLRPFDALLKRALRRG